MLFVLALIYSDKYHICRSLVKHYFNVNHERNIVDGFTPLNLAVSLNMGIARWMIERGADINTVANNGTCPVGWAISNGNSSLLGILIRHYAKNIGEISNISDPSIIPILVEAGYNLSSLYRPIILSKLPISVKQEMLELLNIYYTPSDEIILLLNSNKNKELLKLFAGRKLDSDFTWDVDIAYWFSK